MLFCFLSVDMFVLFTRYSSVEIFVSEVRYSIHQIVVIVQSIWHSLSLINYLLVLVRRIRTIVLRAKPFESEKLNKIDFKLLS